MASNTQKAFTLIELLIVLMISVMALTAVSMNIGSGARGTEIKAAIRELMSAMRYARGQALLTRQSTVLTIDLEHNSYQINSKDKVFYLPNDLEITLVTAQNELLDDNRGNIRFFSDGSSTGGRVSLGQENEQWWIDINWLTGKAELSHD